jgi:hypothetical protein
LPRWSTKHTGSACAWPRTPKELDGARLAIEEGVDTIEHGLSLHREPALLDRMAASGQVLVPTLSTFHDLAEPFVGQWGARLVDQARRQPGPGCIRFTMSTFETTTLSTCIEF